MLTGFLGGAIASNVRVGHPPFEVLFPGIFALIVWAGIYLRDSRVEKLIPLRQ